MNPQSVEVAWLDARESVTAAELSRACGMSVAELDELIEYGALAPQRDATVFSAEWVVPLRVAAKLRRDFDLDLFTVGLLVGYLNRIDALERELRALRARLPAHAHPTHREGPEPWHEPHG